MGNGTSIGQGSHTTYGRRDDGESAKYSNWPELAGAKLAESSELGRVHHSVASFPSSSNDSSSEFRPTNS